MWWLHKKAGEAPAFPGLKYLNTAFIVTFVIYGLMVVIFIFQLVSSVKLERFSPGNPESVRRLDRIWRFRLPRKCRQVQNRWPDFRNDFRAYFAERKWTRTSLQPFDAVMTRRRLIPALGRAPLVDRVFLFYHPMLNVIIVDQVLKECEKKVEELYGHYPAPRNRVIFLTDMKNRDEITSAAAGVVNYLGVVRRGISLCPSLFDMNAGRFFYPIDTSLMARRHRLHYWRTRLLLRAWIRRQAGRHKEAAGERA
ncbi:MAG: hypothetical protein ACOX3M_04530 [Saccharofermentanales bacterium]